MHTQDLLRISAMIHNFEDKTSFIAVLRKVIDYVFVVTNQKELRMIDILQYLKSDNGLLMDFSEDEIKAVCKQYGKIYKTKGNQDSSYIEIDAIYYETCMKQYENKDIDKIIENFYHAILECMEVNRYSLKDTKEAIQLFLYNTLVDSRSDFNKLFLNLGKSTTKAIRTKDINIINSFLEWENTSKDEILESIYFSGYEFAILSAKKNLLDAKTFSSKILYLDTNVIFRLLGINGKELQNRAEIYIKRFKEIGMELRISFPTKLEYARTIDNKYSFIVSQLSNTKSFKMGRLAQFTSENYTFMNFYVDWCNNGNKNIKGFKTFLDGQFEKLTKKHRIIVESNVSFSKTDKEHISELVLNYETSLKYRKSDFIIESDMKNYKHILNLRGNSSKSFNLTKEYFLTNDYQLINFDNNQVDNDKITIHPARLLSLVLRYGGRVVDTEIKSFMKLIKIDINSGDKLPEEVIYVINDQLNRYEPNPDLQKQYLDALFETDLITDFKDLEYDGIRNKANDIFETVSKKIAEEKQRENDKLSKEIEDKTLIIKSNKFKQKYMTLTIGVLTMIIVLLIIYFLYESGNLDRLELFIGGGITIILFIISQIVNFYLKRNDL